MIIYIIRISDSVLDCIKSLMRVNKRFYLLLRSKRTKIELLPFIKDSLYKLDTARGITNYLVNTLKKNSFNPNYLGIYSQAYLYCISEGTTTSFKSNIGLTVVSISKDYFTRSKKPGFFSFTKMIDIFEPKISISLPLKEERDTQETYEFISGVKEDILSTYKDISYNLKKMEYQIEEMLKEGFKFGTKLIQEKPDNIKLSILPYSAYTSFRNDRVNKTWWKAPIGCIANTEIYLKACSYGYTADDPIFYYRLSQFNIPISSQVIDESYKQHPYLSNLYQIENF